MEHDDNFKRKLWGMILKGYVEHFEPPQNRETWHSRLEQLGIRIFQCGDPEPGFVEAICNDNGFMGGVQVPVELAVKIVSLGHMP